MIRAVLRILAATSFFLLWLVMASFLLCFLMHLGEFHLATYSSWSLWPDTFVWPYTQYFDSLRYANTDSKFDTYLIISGVVPALLLGFLATALMMKTQGLRRSLYGSSRWASRQDMRRSGIF